jgi:hypothetical protein
MLTTNVTEFVNSTVPLNTGPITKGYKMGRISKIAFIPHGKQFTETECKTLDSVLKALYANNTQSLRGYPIGDFIDFEDMSESEATEKTGYGQPRYTREGVYQWAMQFDDGDMTYEKAVKSFQGLQGVYDMLIYDYEANIINGTKCPSNTGGFVLQGFDLSMIYTKLVKVNDGKSPSKHMLVVALRDSDEFTKRSLQIQLDPVLYPISAHQGLYNLELAMGTASGSPFTTTTVRLKALTADGHYDLYDTYGAALAALTWTAVTDSTGATLTISSVAVHAATKSLLFTFGSSTSAGATVTVSSPSVSAMAATVPGFANNSIQLTAV